MAVPKKVTKMAEPAPQENAAAAAHGADACRARREMALGECPIANSAR